MRITRRLPAPVAQTASVYSAADNDPADLAAETTAAEATVTDPAATAEATLTDPAATTDATDVGNHFRFRAPIDPDQARVHISDTGGMTIDLRPSAMLDGPAVTTDMSCPSCRGDLRVHHLDMLSRRAEMDCLECGFVFQRRLTRGGGRSNRPGPLPGTATPPSDLT